MKLEHYIEVKVPRRCWIFSCKRKQGFLFDTYAWYLLYREYGTDIGEVGKFDPQTLVARMIHTAAISANKEQGKRVAFTGDDVAEWVDAMTNREIKRLGEVFAQSMKVMSEETGGGKGQKKSE